MAQLSQAIIKTLVYADIFDYPLTSKEIEKFLISPKKYNLERIEGEIPHLLKSGLIKTEADFCFLKGREKILAQRKQRQKWSRKKLAIARKNARFLKIIPWVQAVLLTGALARENADQKDDIDWLVITASNRLWLTRFLTVLILQLLGVRRQPSQQKVKDRICLNMFLTKDCLALPEKERDLFTAHEVLQTKLLWQRRGAYLTFIEANSWAKDYLPKAYASLLTRKTKPVSEGPDKVFPLFFDVLEKLASWFQLFYMKPRRTIEKIEPGRALFHPQDIRGWVMSEYQERLGKLDIGAGGN